jgi:glyoxylase-like metal-dependent hydrolase (beta-lactamase superfamily II)
VADGDSGARATRSGLHYPCEAPPGRGEAQEVAPGVLWLRLSLPFALDHVNVWALADGEGWTLVDTGISNTATREDWETILAGPLESRPVRRVICTHMHPDHIGLAGWLCERFQAPLHMTRLEYVTGRMLLADTGQPAPESGAQYYRASGWTPEQVERYRAEYGGFGRGVTALPSSYQRLTNDDRFTVNGADWQVVVGDGHSPEHACLLRPSDGVFIAGDQILPRISSNISVWPTEPEADPLEDWLSSLAMLRNRLSSDLLVLPSHGEPFTGVHERIDALVRGHQVSLTRLLRTLRKPCRAVDVFSALFARPIGDGVLGMATGESRAHFNYLPRRGLARRQADADGVLWWTATGEPMEKLN